MLIPVHQSLSSLLYLATFFVPAIAKCSPSFTEEGGANGFGKNYHVGHNRKVVDYNSLTKGGYLFTQKQFPLVTGTLTTIFYKDDYTSNRMVEFHLEIDNKDAKKRSLQLAFFSKRDGLSKGPYWLFTISADAGKNYEDCRFAASVFATEILTMQVF